MTAEDNPPSIPADGISSQPGPRIPAWLWLGVVLLVVLSVLSALQTRRLQGDISRLSDQLREQQLRGLALDAERQLHETTLAILSAPTTREFAFQPSDAAASKSQFRAFWNEDKGLLLVGGSLPQLSSGRSFQLWVVPRDGTPLNCGAFRPDTEGKVNFLTTSKVGLREARELWITEEPARDAMQPGHAPPWKARIR